MVIRALYYIITIFIVISLSLLIQDPYKGILQNANRKIATLQMEDVVDYEINKKSISRITRAKEAIKYSDQDRLKYPTMELLKDKLVYTLSSKDGVFQNDKVTLIGNVHFHRDDGITLDTQKASYDLKKKIVYGNAPFTLHQKLLNANGKGFIYHINKKTLSARGIDATYEWEKK